MCFDFLYKLHLKHFLFSKKNMIYLLTAIGLSRGGSITVHIYTQTIHITTQITTNLEESGSCPVFANYTLTFELQLRKKHGKPSARVRKTSVSTHITKTPTYYKTYTHTHTRGPRLRRCATNRKVASSIPEDVIGIFNWHKILPIALWPRGRRSV